MPANCCLTLQRSALTALLTVAGFASTLVSPAAATTIRIADQVVRWDVETVEIPPSSHFGASLALAHAGDGLLIGAPDGGARGAFGFDPDLGWQSEDPGSTWDNTPQFYVLAADFPGVIHTRLEGDDTTSIRQFLPGNPAPPPLVTGITGFVTALAKFGNTLAVGESAFASNAGRVRIYEFSAGSWVLSGAFGGAIGDELGSSLSMKPDMIVAGAPGEGECGSAHVYVDVGSWVELQEIECPSIQVGADFGYAVGIADDVIAIGAPRLDKLVAGGDNEVDVGGVYIFRPAGLLFELETFLRPRESGEGDRFGSSLALKLLEGPMFALAAGSPREDDLAANSGAAYLYLNWGNVWRAHQRLVSGDPEAEDRLGTAVALGTMGVLAGAPNTDNGGNLNEGAVLAFSGAYPLFCDDFESDSLAAWSSAVP